MKIKQNITAATVALVILFGILIGLAFVASNAEAANQYGIGKGNIYSVPTLTTYYLTSSSVTGTTTEKELGVVPVPGGKMGPHGALRIKTLYSYTNSANVKTVKLYFGGQLAHTATMTTTGIFSYSIIIRNKGTVTQNNSQIDTANGPTSGSSMTVNTGPGVSNNISFTCQLSNATETCSLLSYIVEVLR